MWEQIFVPEINDYEAKQNTGEADTWNICRQQTSKLPNCSKLSSRNEVESELTESQGFGNIGINEILRVESESEKESQKCWNSKPISYNFSKNESNLDWGASGDYRTQNFSSWKSRTEKLSPPKLWRSGIHFSYSLRKNISFSENIRFYRKKIIIPFAAGYLQK